ncbi:MULTISPECIES: hypothetical protein [unclassified Streptomyces]|uniref:hypothetical protein n=1 Tax=unclassified Streptomyces TaxID=2593676 RepID=UPI00225B45A0|nr:MULTISPECIES: hypothetical protein [unclassified Streptomyces]MCX5054617.1 hypothetical protein [Streptomyces sp. NBC_00474]
MSRRRLLILGGFVGTGAATAAGLLLSDKLGLGSHSGSGNPTTTPSTSATTTAKPPYVWKVSIPGDFDGSTLA